MMNVYIRSFLPTLYICLLQLQHRLRCMLLCSAVPVNQFCLSVHAFCIHRHAVLPSYHCQASSGAAGCCSAPACKHITACFRPAKKRCVCLIATWTNPPRPRGGPRAEFLQPLSLAFCSP